MDRSEIDKLICDKNYKDAKSMICDLLMKHGEDTELYKLLGLCNINLGCLDEAMENFGILAAKDSEDALSCYYLAVLYTEKENYEEAEKYLKKVIILRENYKEAYISLAIVYMKQKKYEDVLKIKDKLTELAQEDEQIYNIISAAALETGRYDEAAESLETAIRLNPEKAKYYNKLGLVYFAAGNAAKAIEFYKLAIEKDFNDASVFYNLGMAYFSVRNYNPAEHYLQKAYELDNNPCYMEKYAFAALKAKNFKKAKNLYEEIIKTQKEPEDNIKYDLICAYDGNNELEKAVEMLEKLLPFHLDSVVLKLHLASLYSRTKNIEAAKILYGDLIAAGAANPDIMYEYAVLCAKTMDTDKAEEVFKKIILLKPDYALAYKDLAIIYLSRKHFELADENFKKAFKIAPDNIYVIFEYGNYYHLLSEFDKAKKMYLKVLKKENIPVYMLIRIAANYISLNMISGAKKILLCAIKSEPQNIEILFHLAQVYFAEKNYENARQLLEDAYEKNPDTEIANMLAKVYFESGDYESAYTMFGIINLAAQGNIGIIMNMAKCKYAQKDYKTAKEHVETVLKILPESEEANELSDKIKKMEAEAE